MESSDLFDTAARSARELSALLGLVYQGPTEATPWAGLLEELRRQLDASFVTLVLRNPADERPGLIVNASEHGALLPGEPSYSEHYYRHCPFLDMPPDRVASADELFGDAWCEHEFYRQYLQPLDLRYILAANIRTERGVECAFFVSRSHAGHDYGAADKALITVLLPHLARAVDLHAAIDELESERLLYAGAIDRMLVGTVILDESGKVMKSNAAAQRLFADKDGIYLSQDGLRGQDGLRAHCSFENRRLQKVIQAALGHHLTGSARTEVAALSRPSGEAPLSVLIRPIPLNYCSKDDGNGGSPRRPAVAVFIRDPVGSPQASRDMLRKLFGLTATETEIALLMIDGLTLDEVAEALGVTKNTVRAHLRGVFAKTGATRQALLVKMLLNSVAALA